MNYNFYIKKENLSKYITLIKHLFLKDFSNLDLSGMDLSMFPATFWKNIIFKNTNLKNCKINFNPKYNKRLENINFENVDLSNLTDADFNGVSMEGCNFYNTGLQIDFNWVNGCEKLNNIKLDKNMILSNHTQIDINTLNLNENYPFNDQQVLIAIMEYIREKESFTFFPIVKEARNSNYYYEIFKMTEKAYHEKVYNYINLTIAYLKNMGRMI